MSQQVANEVWVIDHGKITRVADFDHYMKQAHKDAMKNQ
jgi:hypothetical protein